MKKHSIITYINKVKKDKKNNAPIYGRIKANGTTKDFSLGIKVNIDRWEKTGEFTNTKMKLTEDEKSTKEKINQKLSDLNKAIRRFEDDNTPFTAEMVYNKAFKSNQNRSYTLLNAFDEHKKWFSQLIALNERKVSGYKKYQSVRMHLEKFLKECFNQRDRLLIQINDDFQRSFHLYLVGKIGQNAVSKYVQHLRTILLFAKEKGMTDTYKLTNYIIKKTKVKKEFLTKEEIDRIVSREFSSKRLRVVKDIFLFNILTNYAWTDISRLTYSDISKIEGKYVILNSRDKTGITANVALTNEAIELIDKYRNDEECKTTGKLFPFRSNQKMNEFLKEIADACNITKRLTTKVARNTYATLGLNRGMDLKVLSRAMGHTNLRQTEEYATLLQSSIIRETSKLEGVLGLAQTKTLKLPEICLN